MILSESTSLDLSNQVYWQEALSIRPSHDAANWATLYPELIYEILAYCQSDITLSADAPESFPWYLGHICQSWRSVSTSSPRFWDRFTFNEAHDGMRIAHLERALAIVELCIERTKGHPFSFKFNDFTDPWSLHRTSLKLQILETLLAHADRWRAAYFFAVDADGFLQNLLTKAKRRFGQLHSLQIRTVWPSAHRTYSDVFQDAPNLTRVYATDYYQLSWSNITVLHIDVDEMHSPHRFFADLDKMTCLEELVISASGLALHHDVANTSPVELPSLKIFSLNRFFRALCIKAPALERLYLSGALDGGLPTAETLLRGTSHLKTLSFHVHDVHVAQIINCTPKLDHLILSCEVASFEAFQSFLRSLGSHATACSLKRITIDAWDLQPRVSIIYVLLIIIKSWAQFPKLHFVSVHVNDNLGEEDITSAIADLMRVGADKGIEIEVNYTPLPTKLPFESW